MAFKKGFKKNNNQPTEKKSLAETTAQIKAKLSTLVTDMLAKGIVPWQIPYKKRNMAHANLVSKKAYRGFTNKITTAVTALACGYNSRFWVTYKQATELGGHVKSGEKGIPVIFWKRLPIYCKPEQIDPETGKKKVEKYIPYLQYSTVFNTDQCEGFEDKIPVETDDIHVLDENADLSAWDRLQEIIDNWKTAPSIVWGSVHKACYVPKKHQIRMPEKTQFFSVPQLVQTAAHELGHGTGIELNRFTADDHGIFGDNEYSFEELVAEMTATIICSEIDVEVNYINSASYLAGWSKSLQNDPQLFMNAALKAQKAAELIFGYNLDEDTETTESSEEKAEEGTAQAA